MSGIETEPDRVTLLVLGAAAVCLGLSGLAGRAVSSARTRTVVGVLAAVLLALFSGVLATCGWPRPAWLPPLVLAGVSGLFLAVRSSAIRRALAWAATPPLQWGALLAGGLLLLPLSWYAYRPMPSSGGWPDPPQVERAQAMASLRDVASPVATTDRGRRVRLLAMPEWALPQAMLTGMEAEMAQEWGLSLRLIRTSPPDKRSNCHGWVFAGGRWWVLGVDVEAILQDNGYLPVREPATGDLVVYRHDWPPITHSGIVSAVRDGQVLVESKWSWLGTYLHAPQDHPYGGYPTYYRSARAGHQLSVAPAPLFSASPQVLGN